MKLYRTSTVKPYIHNGKAGWLYTRTEKSRSFYLHKYQAIADAKEELYDDVIDYLITYTKNGNADYSAFGPRGRELSKKQRELDRSESDGVFWYKKWKEAIELKSNYQTLYEKQQKVINNLKELFT